MLPRTSTETIRGRDSIMAAGHADPTGWRRFVYSTNHKDIGTMYLFVSVLAALIGGAFSIYMRMELMEPGVQYMTNDCLLYTSDAADE